MEGWLKRQNAVNFVKAEMLRRFGSSMTLEEEKEAWEHHGWFRLVYRYIPETYTICFEGEFNSFHIRITRADGAYIALKELVDYRQGLTEHEVREAVEKLQDVLPTDISFYKTENGKRRRETGKRKEPEKLHQEEDTGGRQLSLAEKWEIDAEAYKNGMLIPTSESQCVKCRYYRKDDILHCDVYGKERKPKDVLFSHKKCPSFRSGRTKKIRAYELALLIVAFVLLAAGLLMPKTGAAVLIDEIFDTLIIWIVCICVIVRLIRNKSSVSVKAAGAVAAAVCIGIGCWLSGNITADLITGPETVGLSDIRVSHTQAHTGIFSRHYYLEGREEDGEWIRLEISGDDYTKLDGRGSVTVEYYRNTGRIVRYW